MVEFIAAALPRVFAKNPAAPAPAATALLNRIIPAAAWISGVPTGESAIAETALATASSASSAGPPRGAAAVAMSTSAPPIAEAASATSGPFCCK
ncbi:hypothetical protein GCM10009737_10970 [Nocardioides lentus]|uniref:Uncharacterized protein n=1 Tax=Nocardioides lentus TaxID=338077 RepID=A0ABN2P3B4_9ACTN